MSEAALYPLRFEPMFQYRLWGGRELADFMGADLPGSEPIGEAWLLSDRHDFSSRIANGVLAGKTLTELMARLGREVLGAQADHLSRFPLLLKFLDVEKMLSVQVHPDDDQAELIPEGDTGKTEAWVVLRAKPGARIYAGLKPGTSADDLRTLTAETVDERLASFAPSPGQGVVIEAGTVHALGDGLVVFEVQENSDVTFRLYDWGHVDERTGKPRPLQVDRALAAVDFDRGAVKPVEPRLRDSGAEQMFDDRHFDLLRWRGSSPFPVGSEVGARVLVCVGGAGTIEVGAHAEPMKRGEVVLLPAVCGAGAFLPHGEVTILEIGIPEAR